MATQEYIRTLLTGAAYTAAYDLLRKADYTVEERIHIYEFCINLMKLPFSEGNVEFYADDVS